MIKYTMRKIEKFESGTLAEIHAQCFFDHWSSESFGSMLQNDAFCGFILENKAGFILCKMICGESEIITFCVLPEFRRLGFGRRLLQAVEDHAKQHAIKEIFLDVSEDNIAAINLYKFYNYEEISRRSLYYKKKDEKFSDCIVMRKNCLAETVA